jgi:hypothetical protein
MERDSYYVFQAEFPQLEILRRYITKAQTEEAVAYFLQEKFNPNAYIKGHKQGTWVPLLYQCLQDKRLTPLIKLLLKQGGKVAQRPDGPAPPLIFVCDDIYFDYLVKRLPFDPESLLENLYTCFLYGKHKRIEKLLTAELITDCDIAKVQKKYPNMVFEMIDTCVKYLTYYYGAQLKKGDPEANLKKCTTETLEKYVLLCNYIAVESIQPAVIDLTVRYYLFEILQAFRQKGYNLPSLKPVYAAGGAKEAILRPLLNDYRYEQTCLVLNQTPDPCIYENYNPL